MIVNWIMILMNDWLFLLAAMCLTLAAIVAIMILAKKTKARMVEQSVIRRENESRIKEALQLECELRDELEKLDMLDHRTIILWEGWGYKLHDFIKLLVDVINMRGSDLKYIASLNKQGSIETLRAIKIIFLRPVFSYETMEDLKAIRNLNAGL
jgi:hypothetical protein